MRRRTLLTWTPLLALPAARSAESHGPYALPNTATHEVPDPVSGRKYQLWVDLPKSYDAGHRRRYPTVLTTDAPYAFPLLRSIRLRVGQSGRNIEDFILVGLAPPTDEASTETRSRDYTPTDPRTRAAVADTYAGREYGGASQYLKYLETIALPYLDGEYRTEPTRRVYVGHSYGGLLGAFALLTQPQLFTSYILGSPSFWFDRRVIFDIEDRAARSLRDIRAQVLLYCGSYETLKPGARYYKSEDLLGDMKAFASRLTRRAYRSLRVEAHVLQDEDHFTVFPNLATRGLIQALPGAGPYLSG